ncbi:MAG: hypothetical protein KDC11_06135, partial [Chitinophagaceae bacterium]|nr:hypothetical protein [Chitinophagaceae bacterium]
MRVLTTIAIWVLSISCLIQPFRVVGGGPGFNNDVYTWGAGGGSDSTCNNWNDDDDGYYNCDDDAWNNDCNDIPLDGGLGFLGAA